MEKLQHFDERVSHSLYRFGLRVPRSFWRSLECSGDGVLWLVLTLSVMALPGIADGTRCAWTNLLLGLLIDLAETGLAKLVCRRERPHYNRVAKDMVVVVSVDHYSFPSGHSSR
jgi:presqualene diphosphate phosphatase